jgi:hypothetical protein
LKNDRIKIIILKNEKFLRVCVMCMVALFRFRFFAARYVLRVWFSRCGFAAFAPVAPLMALYGVFSFAPCPVLVLYVRAV